MVSLDKRIKRIEGQRQPPVIWAVTNFRRPKRYYIGQREFNSVEEIRAAFPGRRVQCFALNTSMDLGEI